MSTIGRWCAAVPRTGSTSGLRVRREYDRAPSTPGAAFGSRVGLPPVTNQTLVLSERTGRASKGLPLPSKKKYIGGTYAAVGALPVPARSNGTTPKSYSSISSRREYAAWAAIVRGRPPVGLLGVAPS